MTSIDIIRSSPNHAATTVADMRMAMVSRLRRAWARNLPNAIGGARRLLSLNDRLLRDIGENRVELEYEARFWSIWPFQEYCSKGCGSRRF